MNPEAAANAFASVTDFNGGEQHSRSMAAALGDPDSGLDHGLQSRFHIWRCRLTSGKEGMRLTGREMWWSQSRPFNLFR